MVTWFAKKKKPTEKKEPSWILREVALSDPSLMMGGVNVYNPSVLVTRKGLDVFENMIKDDMVKASLGFIKHSILSTDWELAGGNDKIADTISAMFDDVKGTFYDALLGVLTSLEYGYSVCEKIYEVKNGQIWLKRLKSLSPKYIEFRIDKKGNVSEVLQFQDSYCGEYTALPIPKLVICQNEPKFDNPYGTSELEAAYRPWLVKDNSYKWLAMALERRGVPSLFALYDPNKYRGGVLSDLKDVLSNIQASTVGAIPKVPDGLDFWEPQTAKDSKDVFEAAIKIFNRDIARALLLPSMIGFGDEDSAGSMARSQTHFDSFIIVTEHIRKRLSDVIQEQVVIPVSELNFGVTSEVPVFRFIPRTDESKVEMMKTWGELVRGNVVGSTDDDEKHIRAIFKMPEAPEGSTKQTPKDAPPPKDDQSMEPQKKETFSVTTNFKFIENGLNDLENKSKEGMVTALENVRDNLIKSYDENMKPSDVKGLQLRGMGPVQDVVMEMLRVGFQMGGKDGSSEIGQKKFAFNPFTPVAALAYLSNKKFWITGIIKDSLLKDSKAILYNAIKTGELAGETQRKLKDLFEKYVGSDTLPEHITPYRLETIIRTNVTDAYNYGRLVEFKQNAKLLLGVRYSAILDTRTTEQCQLLDGKVFKVDDPNLAKFTPPLHYNCRSVLVPVPIGSKLTPEEMVTPSQIGKANELVPPSFGGA